MWSNTIHADSVSQNRLLLHFWVYNMQAVFKQTLTILLDTQSVTLDVDSYDMQHHYNHNIMQKSNTHIRWFILYIMHVFYRIAVPQPHKKHRGCSALDHDQNSYRHHNHYILNTSVINTSRNNKRVNDTKTVSTLVTTCIYTVFQKK